MAIPIHIPQLGMTMTDATLIEWKAQEGDWVEKEMQVTLDPMREGGLIVKQGEEQLILSGMGVYILKVFLDHFYPTSPDIEEQLKKEILND